jgi:hypothetical protein
MGLSGRTLPVLRIAGLTVAVSLVTAAGVGYWFFVSQQRDYIIGRDFRILTNLTKQIDSTAHAEAQVIRNLPNASVQALPATWSKLRGKPYKVSDIRFTVNTIAGATDRLTAEPRLHANSLILDVPLENAGREKLTAALNLQPALETLFSSTVGPGAFDAILLGARDGRVLVSAGSGAEQLRFSGLDVLATKGTDVSKPVKFKELSEAITMAEVTVGGVDYTLFVAPCCLKAKTPEDRLVLAGLVRSDKVRAGSWAIPTTLVKISVLALLIVLVGWPFLKLVLLGDRQQVGITDFFQLGASGVAGLAILTVVLLDVSAYRRLNLDLDVQLKDLAHRLDHNATSEITDAYAQLTCIEDTVRALGAATLDKRIPSVLLKRRFECSPRWEAAVPNSPDQLSSDAPASKWRYPFFDTVAFIDTTGKQQLKLVTSANRPNLIDVGQREYFKTIARGGGWKANDFCDTSPCALESVWSMTTGEAQAVLSKKTDLKMRVGRNDPNLAVAAISFSMRSLIGPVLPPGFAFAVIDDLGNVLFHSDLQRNGNEKFFVETDNNRRLRAQVAAHSADALTISYWGAQYRAYVKPMQLPGMYVVAMAQSERAWAINREWLVVTLTLLAAYLLLWLVLALFTLAPSSSWVWPDPGRRERYRVVSIVCVVLLGIAIGTSRYGTPAHLVLAGVLLPILGWGSAFTLLKASRRCRSGEGRETLIAYTVASVLVLLVSGVIPGSMLFLASYRLHAWSYIKNSQLIVAHRLAERYDRLNEAYLLDIDGEPNPKKPAASYTNIVSDRDIYVDFLYAMSVNLLNTPGDAAPRDADGHEQTTAEHDAKHHDDMLLSLLEDYLPYYSEASVEWRELLHNRSEDESWKSWRGARDVDATLEATTGKLVLRLKSWVPSISGVPSTREGQNTNEPGLASLPSVVRASVAPPSPVHEEAQHEEPSAHNSEALLFLWSVGLVGLAWSVVEIFKRRVYLVGITLPLWACGSLARNAGQNVLVLCDARSKAEQLKGMPSLDLMPIVKAENFKCVWRKALFDLDRRNGDGSVLIADFDKDLDDLRSMDRKVLLLEELVLDPSRRVVVLSKVSLRGLIDSVHLSAGASSAAPDAREAALGRWRSIMKALVIVERRRTKPSSATQREQCSPAVRFLLDERESHPDVRRVCDDLLQSDAVAGRPLSRAQAFDELVERTARCYRGLWMSCSQDEKVVLGHVARHGLANSSARSIVRQLLGRGFLHVDPALRPMNETFRHFILTRECSKQVEALQNEDGPSAWDRLRIPLGVAVVGAGIFLFATQKELYNAIFGLVTAAAASVPALIQTVGKLVGQPVDGPGQKA